MGRGNQEMTVSQDHGQQIKFVDTKSLGSQVRHPGYCERLQRGQYSMPHAKGLAMSANLNVPH